MPADQEDRSEIRLVDMRRRATWSGRLWRWNYLRNTCIGVALALLVPDQPRSAICTVLVIIGLDAHDKWSHS